MLGHRGSYGLRVLWCLGLRVKAVQPHGVRAFGCNGFIVLGYYGLGVGAQSLSVFMDWERRVLGRGVSGL